MPPAPVFLERSGEKGPLEILLQSDAQSLGDSDGDVDAPGEVRVQLQGVEEHPHQHIGAVIGIRVPDDGVDPHQHPVRDDHFLEIAPQNALQSKIYRFSVKSVFPIQGFRQIPEPADRPLHQLGKEGHEQGEPERVPLCPDCPPVHVDQIPHRLEGVEGNPQGQRKGQERKPPRPAESPQQPVDVGDGEVGVLQHRQDTDVQKDSPQYPSQAHLFLPVLIGLFLLFGQLRPVLLQVGRLPVGVVLNPAGREPDCHRGHQEVGHIFRPRQEIEEVAGSQQQPPLAFPGDNVVQQEQDRKKSQKSIRCKKHDRFLLSLKTSN